MNDANLFEVDETTVEGRQFIQDADEFLSRASPRPINKRKSFSTAKWLEKAISFFHWVDSLEETNPVLYFGIFTIVVLFGAEALVISAVEGGWEIVWRSLLETFCWR